MRNNFGFASLTVAIVLAGCAPSSNIGGSLPVNSQIARLPSVAQCFVRDTQSSTALPSFAAFSYVRDGALNSSAFSRPDLAQIVMASNNDVLKKARYIEYVRAVTTNDQEAIQLVDRVRRQENACFENGIQSYLGRYYDRFRAMAPNQRINTGSRIITAQQALAEIDTLVRGLRENQSISRRLYENIIADLRRGRKTQNIIASAAAYSSQSRSQPPKQIQPRPDEQNREPPSVMTPQEPTTVPSIPVPQEVDPTDRDFAESLAEARRRGLLG